jgi:peptidoglycan-N-acetylglucosamine deacetylase
MKTYPLWKEVSTKEKLVALTFDDGPHPEYTLQLLELFDRYQAKATFYVTGENVKAFPDIAASVHCSGHELGNHTYSHPHLTALEKPEQLQELESTEALIQGITGSKPLTLRPPYFDYNEEVGELCEQLGYAVIGGVNFDTEDWREPGVEHIVTTSRRHIRNGSILVFHDGYGDRSQTVEAMRILVPELVEQGYELVTVSRLLERSWGDSQEG